MAGNKVVVNIYGEEYPITGVTDPAHISRVADLVDTRMNQTADSSRVKSKDKVAILAAMSIASELLDRTEELSTVDRKIAEQLQSLVTRLDNELPNLRQPR